LGIGNYQRVKSRGGVIPHAVKIESNRCENRENSGVYRIRSVRSGNSPETETFTSVTVTDSFPCRLCSLNRIVKVIVHSRDLTHGDPRPKNSLFDWAWTVQNANIGDNPRNRLHGFVSFLCFLMLELIDPTKTAERVDW
jgi:hypothetical protein